jgi:hypothetical protein
VKTCDQSERKSHSACKCWTSVIRDFWRLNEYKKFFHFLKLHAMNASSSRAWHLWVSRRRHYSLRIIWNCFSYLWGCEIKGLDYCIWLQSQYKIYGIGLNLDPSSAWALCFKKYFSFDHGWMVELPSKIHRIEAPINWSIFNTITYLKLNNFRTHAFILLMT